MLSDIYLISTVLSAGITCFSMRTMMKKLEREGYKQKEENLSIPERIMVELKVWGFLLIPIFNVAFALTAFLNFDDLYNYLKEELLKEGKIIPIKKINENVIKNSGEKLMLDKKDTVINLPLHSVDVNNSKKIGEMTKKFVTKEIDDIINSKTFICSIYLLKYMYDKDEEYFNKFVLMFKEFTPQEQMQVMCNVNAKLKELRKGKSNEALNKMPKCSKFKPYSYVHSNDEEMIANMLDNFEYDPSKREKVLTKYNELKKYIK